MNRNLIATIVVIFIIAGAGGFYFMNRQAVAPAANNETQTPVASIAVEKSSIKDFMAMSGNQRCVFSDAETGNSGTVYLNSGKMRGDFSSNTGGQVSNTHMINDSENIYIWINNQTTGFKTTLTDVEKMSEMSGQNGVSQSVDINKKVDYKCEAWSVDSGKFVIPAEIKFQDMGKMMENLGNMMQVSPNPNASGASAEACAACDSLTGGAQDQCKRALKCN